jgi:cyclic-di-GMP phosphodiesterase TipF (flagellum assembly factor)
VVNGLEMPRCDYVRGFGCAHSMTRVLLVLTYLLFSTAIGGAIGLFGGVPMGTIAGCVVFLLLAQLDGSFMRRRDRRDHAIAIARLQESHDAVELSLDETRVKMDEVSKTLEARADARSRKIVSELMVLESLMREFAGRIANKSRPEALDGQLSAARSRTDGVSYLAALSEPDLLETIRASLEENRVDLYLQPIVSLPQRKLRFYEALSRLRAEDGSVIMPAQYMKVAAPAGLMSIVDNLLLFRCVQIVRRLTQKHREVAVFCNISGDTLADTEFFPQFLDYMQQHRDLANNIVFEFEQASVLEASVAAESNLRYLASLGFALSMDHVSSLALDFDRLKATGFRYLKVRAETLTEGMSGARAAVAAEDFKLLLQRHGLNLIAERVENEKTVVQLLDYGVDFAQGFLFGEPRAVRDDSFKPVKEPASAPVIPLRRAG